MSARSCGTTSSTTTQVQIHLETLPRQRPSSAKLTNLGLRSDLSYVKGIHNVKMGATFQHTLLTEDFSLGLTDPAINRRA